MRLPNDLVITTAHAYVPVQFIAPFIVSTLAPADTLHRLARMLGVRSTLAAGIDCHGRLAVRAAKARGLGIRETVEEESAAFAAWLDRFRIAPTVYFRTDSSDFAAFAGEVVADLKASNRLQRARCSNFRCSACSEYLSRSDIGLELEGDSTGTLLKQRFESAVVERLNCRACGADGTVEVVETSEWKVLLDHERPEWLKSRGRTLERVVSRLDREAFSEWQITRPDYFGLRPEGLEGLSCYLWVDAVIAKLKAINSHRAAYGASDQIDLACFFGRNILTYYAHVLPTFLASSAAHRPNSATLCCAGLWNNFRESGAAQIGDSPSPRRDSLLRLFGMWKLKDDAVDYSASQQDLDEFEERWVEGTLKPYFRLVDPRDLPTELSEALLERAAFGSIVEDLAQFRLRSILLTLLESMKEDLRALRRGEPAEGKLADRSAVYRAALPAFCPDLFGNLLEVED